RSSPTSVPHPYTTLFRSDQVVIFTHPMVGVGGDAAPAAPFDQHSTAIEQIEQVIPAYGDPMVQQWPLQHKMQFTGAQLGQVGPRSEEHTSELQSRENLVC